MGENMYHGFRFVEETPDRLLLGLAQKVSGYSSASVPGNKLTHTGCRGWPLAAVPLPIHEKRYRRRKGEMRPTIEGQELFAMRFKRRPSSRPGNSCEQKHKNSWPLKALSLNHKNGGVFCRSPGSCVRT